ncbi:hypothetical protein CCACVL1_08402, partial [Corchorus capsularis]
MLNESPTRSSENFTSEERVIGVSDWSWRLGWVTELRPTSALLLSKKKKKDYEAVNGVGEGVRARPISNNTGREKL